MTPVPTPPAARNIVINAVRLSDEQLAGLERTFNTRVPDGAYWYDKACGAWGMQGGPTAGYLPAGMGLGGPLRADASGGGTGVFINGRELHMTDVLSLQQLVPVMPGRYWVDAAGNCGIEGNPTPLLNLMQLVAAARQQAGGGWWGGQFHRNENTGIGCGGDGKTSYVMGKDFSVIVGE